MTQKGTFLVRGLVFYGLSTSPASAVRELLVRELLPSATPGSSLVIIAMLTAVILVTRRTDPCVQGLAHQFEELDLRMDVEFAEYRLEVIPRGVRADE